MVQVIEAVYEDGVFKPLRKRKLKRGKFKLFVIDEKEHYKTRKAFIESWKPLDLGKKIPMELVEKIRAERYESDA